VTRPERNIKLIVEYDGTAYAGWQIQPDQRTVQGEITRAIDRVTGETVALIGAGRTDAGVHALGQTANFRVVHDLPAERFRDALNYYLDDDIRVRESAEAPLVFHARYDAAWKRYRYLLGSERSALHRHRRWDHLPDLDEGVLREAAAAVAGEHDFAPFCVAASRKEDNRCRIEYARWRRVGPLLIFEIRGNRFLHGMVRSLVGAMVNAATVEPDRNKQNLTLSAFRDIITGNIDTRVAFTAPARGLYLVSVGYR
jgi:tRNA pseudouridine38-40 synthase